MVEELERQDEEAKKDEIDCIDLFSVRMLSLLVCRGRANEKASFLASMANLDNEEPVSWDNTRLSRGLKLLLYISGILPNKFAIAYRDYAIFKKSL